MIPVVSSRSPLSTVCLSLMMLLGLLGCAAKSGGAPKLEPTKIGNLEGAPVVLKTVPRATYFIGEYELPVEEIDEQTKPLAEKVGMAAVRKAKLDIVGPLTLFLPDWRQKAEGNVPVGIGFPVSGKGQQLPRYKRQSMPALKCLTVVREAGEDNTETWKELYKLAASEGLEASGDNRTVIKPSDGSFTVELQLGVR